MAAPYLRWPVRQGGELKRIAYCLSKRPDTEDGSQRRVHGSAHGVGTRFRGTPGHRGGGVS
ncbi:hypothetical protein GQ600_13181 [Phytophthora cactorum]|nr:hypothetical protein GQ600_13181 [Phytophthora cactorum]